MGIWTSVIACFWDVDGRYVWTLSAFFACALHFMHYSFVKCPSGALDKGENEKGKMAIQTVFVIFHSTKDIK